MILGIDDHGLYMHYQIDAPISYHISLFIKMISWHVKIFVKKPNDFTMAKVTGPEMFEFTTCWGHDPAIFWVLKSRWSIHRCTNTISCYKNARSSFGFFIFYQKKAIEQRMKNIRTTFFSIFFSDRLLEF